MSDTPDVFVIGTIKMLAQLGQTEKIVELCNEWLDKFESRPTPLAPDVAYWLCKTCGAHQYKDFDTCGDCNTPRG